MKHLRQQMLTEIKQKTLFNYVQQYGLEYLSAMPKRPVYPTQEALTQLDGLVEALPQSSGDAIAIVEQLQRLGAPATVAYNSGRYFGFVNGGVIPVALAARLLADFWDQNTALYAMSPLASKLEEVCESWLQELFDLPSVVAGFVSGSSLGILCGIVAGRYRIFNNLGWDINRKGFYGAPRIRVVASRGAHATVVKAITLLGIGTANIEWVETDSEGRMLIGEIPSLTENTIIILQAGNVNSGAFDDFEVICTQAQIAGAWVHIDGAFGLWARTSKALRYLTQGIEKANSFSLDGHKTLNTPYDNGIVLCNDEQALTHALHASGSYMVQSEQRDGMFYTPEMSRRARAVELWATLKYLGVEGIDALVLEFHQRAAQAAAEFKAAGFLIQNDVVFNQVLIACNSDALTSQTLLCVQRSGECWVSGTVWHNKPAIRFSVCSWVTTAADISRAVRTFINARQKALDTTTAPR